MDELKDRLYVFYERWNPENLGNVPQIAVTFANREEELWKQMGLKYGPEAVRQAALEHERRVGAAKGFSTQQGGGTYGRAPPRPPFASGGRGGGGGGARGAAAATRGGARAARRARGAPHQHRWQGRMRGAQAVQEGRDFRPGR